MVVVMHGNGAAARNGAQHFHVVEVIGVHMRDDAGIEVGKLVDSIARLVRSLARTRPAPTAMVSP